MRLLGSSDYGCAESAVVGQSVRGPEKKKEAQGADCSVASLPNLCVEEKKTTLIVWERLPRAGRMLERTAPVFSSEPTFPGGCRENWRKSTEQSRK